MKKLLIFGVCCFLSFQSFVAEANVYITMSSGYYAEDARGNLNCFPHAFSRCYDIICTGNRQLLVLNGGTTNNGDAYDVAITDNFQLYYFGTDNGVSLTVYDGSNNGNGTQYNITQFTQTGGGQQTAATFTFK